MRRATRLCTVLAAWVSIVLGVLLGPAVAGPARYDKNSKSFRFAYTFADLPGGVGSVVGTVRQPTPDQQNTVRSLVGQVSDILSQVTNGRAQIGQLDYVDNIKDADLVISLVGAPASPGWANLRSIDGQPGQIVLYYESLLPRIKQDVVFTAAHEILHYVFGLTDEYNQAAFPAGCPRGSGPGCLMDNYNAGARGFMGRLCNRSDHDVEPAQRLSCQEIVDQFFQQQGVGPGGEVTGATTAATTGVATPTETTTTATTIPDPLPSIIDSTIARVRARRLEALQQNRTGAATLRTFARTTLLDLIDRFNRDNPNKIVMGTAQITRALEEIVRAGEVVQPSRPEELDPTVFDQIKVQAERLAEDVKDVRLQSTRLSRIRTGLRQFVRELIRLDQIDTRGFAPTEQTRLIDQLARQAARDPQQRAFDRLVGVVDLEAELDLAIAEDIVAVLDELNVPGTAQRLAALARIRTRLSQQFSIPGRTFERFGTRRTWLITPDPISSGYEYVLTQGGVFPYTTIRDRSTVDFSRLINRSRIELARPVTRREEDFQPLAARIDLPFEAIPSEDPSVRRQVRVGFNEVVAETVNQLERNRLENIAVLVPPGNLPVGLGEQIPVIRSRLRSDIDVRLDMVLVGATTIASELRHVVAESQGSVLTVTDLDEIGSIAQRLRNEESSGAWVIVPQQGTIAPEGVEPLSPNELKASLTKLEDETPALDGKLDAVRRELVKALDDAHLLESTRRRIEEAIQLIDSFRMSLADLAQQAEEMAAQLSEDSAQLKGEPNRTLMNRIGLAREQLGRGRRMIEETPTTPSSDHVVKAVNTLQQPGQLGPNLGRLAELVRRYEWCLEASLLVSDDIVPIYKRINRAAIEAQRRQIEIAGIERTTGLANVPGSNLARNQVRLARFYVEGNAEIELIVGLSQELPLMYARQTDGTYRAKPRNHPELRLFSDLGVEVADSAKMQPDQNTSTPSLLVYRAPAPRVLNPGWYTPILTFDQDVFEQLQQERVNYTFSVGSARPNIQLITGVVQATDTSTRGTLSRADGPAVVEVQVSAGSSVLGAHITGYAERIFQGSAPIVPQEVFYRDDGTDQFGNPPGSPDYDPRYCDRAANDGIYTTFIPLIGVEQPTEFRVFVQADTTDGRARYIALDDPNRDDGRTTASDREAQTTADRGTRTTAANRRARTTAADRGTRTTDTDRQVRQDQSTAEAEGTALKFQRATSVHFQVTP